MLNLDTPYEYFVHIVKEYMFRKSKGIGMTKEQFEIKIDNMKVDASRYFSKNQLEETERLMRRFYTFVTNPDVERRIENGEVTEKYLIELFCKTQEISREGQEATSVAQLDKGNKDSINVGLEALRNDDMILDDSNGSKKIKYKSIPNAIENEYHDSKGNYILIQEIGRIIYSHSINFENDISKYKVTIRDIRGKLSVIEVYSNLRLADMSDEDYRRAILDKLFDEVNLKNFNYRGYIGEVEKKTDDDDKANNQIINGGLIRIINANYVIKYKSEDLTAVGLFEELQQAKSANKSQNQVKIEADGNMPLIAKGR